MFYFHAGGTRDFDSFPRWAFSLTVDRIDKHIKGEPSLGGYSKKGSEYPRFQVAIDSTTYYLYYRTFLSA